MNPEASNAVAAPIACIQEIAAGIDPALPRIVAHGRCFSNPFQPSIGANGKRCNRIVQPVCGVKKFPVGRYQNL
jgi:hypothetical protein